MFGERVVTASGELDIAVVPALREQWLAVIAEYRPAKLIVDFRDVTFMDATGLGLIAAARCHQARHDGTVSVINANPKIVRLFVLTGLDYLLADQSPAGRSAGQPDASRRWGL